MDDAELERLWAYTPDDEKSELEILRRVRDKAVASERERCAKLAEEYAAEKWTAYKQGREPDRADPRAEGASDGAEEIARRIRDGAPDAAPVRTTAAPGGGGTGYLVAVEWRDKCKALESEIAQLRAALKPFADYAAVLIENHHPDEMMVGYYFPPRLTVGDCRRAAELLAQRDQEAA